jgi:hypothetical protein
MVLLLLHIKFVQLSFMYCSWQRFQSYNNVSSMIFVPNFIQIYQTVQ